MEKISLDFLKNGITSFLKNFDINISHFSDYVNAKIPIYILNTGDLSFLSLISGALETKSIETHESVPRIVFDINDINIRSDQISNPYKLGLYTNKVIDQSKDFLTSVRRIPIEIPMSGMAYFSNILQYFEFVQYFASVMYKLNKFTFIYAGKIWDASYSLDDSLSSEVRKTISLTSDSKYRTAPINCVLTLQMPAYNPFNSEVLSADKRMKIINQNYDVVGNTETIVTDLKP